MDLVKLDMSSHFDVKIKLEGGMMPQMKSSEAAAFDLYCPEDTPITFGRQVVDLKFKMEMPPVLKANIRARSGYTARGLEVIREKNGIRERASINADVRLGLVDSDYRDNVGVLLYVDYTQSIDLQGYNIYIPKGERIAQMDFEIVPLVKLLQTETLDMSNDRGGGFGHTNEK